MRGEENGCKTSNQTIINCCNERDFSFPVIGFHVGLRVFLSHINFQSIGQINCWSCSQIYERRRKKFAENWMWSNYMYSANGPIADIFTVALSN